MTARRKLIIAALMLLVCGLVIAVMMRRASPPSSLVITLNRLSTNHGIVTAFVTVSNASPLVCEVAFIEGGPLFLLSPGKNSMVDAQLRWKADQLHITSSPAYTGKLSDQVRRLIRKPEVYTLDLK